MKFRSRTDDDFRDALQLASVGLCQSDGFVNSRDIPGMAEPPERKSAFAVAIGCKADMDCCSAYVRL
jgi:hypothetical protein